ncbi:MAG: redox-regulated ATPase YchF [Candidatus Woesearchaeota archaeon]|jgi:hypothetical protein|nr:redox-regulated ATPase YchF [Candidatus Woesearchaeota archaeon]MDP7458026.1 redox-regulated ATPase YchF [Candidatus Woesearchaeota archaeon]
MIIGVVGKPNVGKSTFFKAATLAEVEIGNYPFVTVKPNSGVGYVRVDCVDKEFGVKCMPRQGYCLNSTRFVPVELIDVAGLVPGAHEGKGMGNQFLDDLRQADVLVHVIDIAGATNEKGEACNPGDYDPAEDIKFLEVELDMWIYQLIKKGWDKFSREVQQNKEDPYKAIARHLTGLGIDEDFAETVIKSLNLGENLTEWNDDTIKKIATELRKRKKPMIIACNKIDLPNGKENFEKLKAEFPDYIFVPCSAESELALKEAAKHDLIDYIPGSPSFEVKEGANISEKQQKGLEFLKANILEPYKTTGIQDVLDKSVFELLQYMAIFPGGVSKLEDKDGNVLPDCFLIPKDSTALDFAYKIHSDLGDKFIRAIDVKTKMTVGKDHVLKNRDVVEIVSDK